MRSDLGETQAKILAYIEQFSNENGYSPSVREICEATGLKSTSTVHGHLLRLQKKGLLNRNSMKMRAISVAADEAPMPVQEPVSVNTVSVPLVGTVAAGQPIFASENIEEYLELPASMTSAGENFALRIKGRSMINAGIMDGDTVVVRKQNTAYNGEIVIAMIGDEATCKRFYRENGRFRLQPENETMDPIYADDVTILGKVVSLYRQF